MSLWPEAALQTWVAAQASQNHDQPCTQPPLRPARPGKADLTAQLRRLVPDLGLLLGEEQQGALPAPAQRCRWRRTGKKAQESGAGFWKGSVSEQQPWVPEP